ncbi:hypothetical protein LT493_26535 [Streptomyces tricolor]|nr:hypothetical protein [Streptomyces tricolor]
MLASGAFEVKRTCLGEGHVDWPRPCSATLIAFASGYAVIAWFMKWISNKSFMPFVWYRVALGIVIIALVSAGVLSPHAAGVGGLTHRPGFGHLAVAAARPRPGQCPGAVGLLAARNALPGGAGDQPHTFCVATR